MDVIKGRFAPINNGTNEKLWGPFIDVHLLVSDYKEKSVGPEIIAKRAIPALLDTGAQNSSIDAALVREIGWKKIREGISFIVGNPNKASMFAGNVYIPGTQWAHDINFIDVDFSSPVIGFKILLGWEFLRLYDLEISRQKNVVLLTRNSDAN